MLKRNRPSGVHQTGLEKVSSTFFGIFGLHQVVVTVLWYPVKAPDVLKLCPDQGSKFPSSVRLPPLSPFGRSNRLSTLFKLATVMQLTQNALWPGHTALHTAHYTLHHFGRHCIALLHFGPTALHCGALCSLQCFKL